LSNNALKLSGNNIRTGTHQKEFRQKETVGRALYPPGKSFLLQVGKLCFSQLSRSRNDDGFYQSTYVFLSPFLRCKLIRWHGKNPP
jgi:hypothetical protein